MYLHLWNTWIHNESSQIEDVDSGSKIYYFFPFSSFCECVCVCFCVRVCLYSFAFTICSRVLSVRSFYLFFFLLSKIFFHNNILFFYFNNYFILSYFIWFYFILSSFFLSYFLFFLPFILSRVDERILVLQPGVSAVPLRRESQLQDTGPQETSQLHVISNGENLREISISTRRPSFTQRPASYSAGHPMPDK